MSQPDKHRHYFSFSVAVLAVFMAGSLLAFAVTSQQAAITQNDLAARTRYFVQSASGESESGVVAALFRADPAPGHVLVAVVATSAESDIPSRDGWSKLIGSRSGERPSQAVWYREVMPGDRREVVWNGLPKGTPSILHVYEYQHLDLSQSPLASHAAGVGAQAWVDEPHGPSEQWLDLSAVAVIGRETMSAWSPEDFSIRRMIKGNGSDALTAAFAERMSLPTDDGAYALSFGDSGPWVMQTVSFATSMAIESVQSAASPEPPLVIETSLDRDTISEGETATMTVQVMNPGASEAEDLQISVRVPNDVRLRSASAGAGAYLPRAGIWNIPALGAGQSATLTLTVEAPAGSADATMIWKARVGWYDGMDELATPAWDAVRLAVRHYPRLNPDDVVCPEIVPGSVLIPEGSEPGERVNVRVSATHATYVLVAQGTDILTAEAAPYSTSIPFTLSGPADEVVVWFASACDQSFGMRSGEEPSVPGVTMTDTEAEETTQESGGDEQETGETPDQETEEDGSQDEESGEGDEEETPVAACTTSVTISEFLYIGRESSQVLMLQKILACHGFYFGEYSTIFDAATYNAVYAFQAANGLQTTGVVDSVTRDVLNAR